MAIEFVEANTKYEAFVHWVGENSGQIYEDYFDVDEPGIEAVWSINFGTADIVRSMAWVDLSERAEVKIKHDVNLEIQNYHNTPYGVWDYPVEKLFGERILYGDTWLVADVQNDKPVFTPLSEVIESERLTPYTFRWLNVIANGNYFPSFFSKIDHLVTGESMSTAEKFRQLREQASTQE